jgi:tetratricopeptide (TPR) repeat protein
MRRELGDKRGIADSLRQLGEFCWELGQLEESERLVCESLAVFQETGDRAGVVHGMRTLGLILLYRGKSTEAHSLLEEALALATDLGLGQHKAVASRTLGLVEMNAGRYKGARARVQGRTDLAFARELVERRWIGFSCFVLGAVSLAEEDYVDARRLLREAIPVYRETMDLGILGQALGLLGIAERGLGRSCQAERHLYDALQVAAKVGPFLPLMYTLPATALLLIDRGEVERAVELYALASYYPIVANSRWFDDVAGKHVAAVAATLPPEVVAAAEKRGRQRDLWATVEELLVELKKQVGADSP